MDGSRFDSLTRSLSTAGSRRRALSGLLAGLLSFLGEPHGAEDVLAGKGKRKRAKKKGNKKKRPCGGCSGGTICCGSQCVSVLTDPNNCGSCGTQCDVDEACSNGQCTRCEFPLSVCGTQCVNLNTDANNCGACGAPCPKDPVNPRRDLQCQNRQCVCTGTFCQNGRCCPAGYSVCVGEGSGCCPTGFNPCPNGQPVDCCEVGYTCGGTCGQNCCRA